MLYKIIFGKNNIKLRRKRDCMDILDKYPELKDKLEKLLHTKRNDILNNMLETDNEYKTLCDERVRTSTELKNMLVGFETDILFEEYSDAIYAQEVYELEAVYKQGFIDAIDNLHKQNLI